MNTNVPLKVNLYTLSVIIAGLYCHYSSVDPIAIPETVYYELAEKLVPYLEKWNYDNITFEDWIKYNLIILPKPMVNDMIDEMRNQELYFERDNGNVMLVISANMSEVTS